MKITENLVMLEVHVPRGDSESIIYPTLTWDDGHLVLFDTGYPQASRYIVAAIAQAGFDVADLTDIILTHQDVDHIGGARELLALAPKARTYAHEVDAPFISGQKVPTKLDGLQQRLDRGEVLSDGDLAFYQMLKAGFAQAQFTVDTLLKDDELLDFCGGIKTVFTPGHTPGHASFYLQKSASMICGDAANIAHGQLIGSNPRMTWDIEQAAASLAKIKSYEPHDVISYHTGYLKF